MLRFKGIQLKTKTTIMGNYVTSAEADAIVEYAIKRYDLKEELYSDGRRHLGTEFSKIYKALFPRILDADEMVYLEGIPKLQMVLNKHNIPFNMKGLTLKEDGPKYIQLVSYRMVAIYLGKLKLSNSQINLILGGVKPIQLIVSDSMCVAGNKPVNIQGKPLVKIVQSKKADGQIQEAKIIELTHEGLKVSIPKSASMEYVKTGLLLRKDLYITLKALSANNGKHMYEVLEDLLLNKCWEVQ